MIPILAQTGQTQGHAIIINMSSGLPFVLQWNPQETKSTKKINYIVAPNIGGSHKKRYFAGFDSEEISFSIVCYDKRSPLGVKNQISYFKQLSSPDPGLIGIAGSFFGNENYPPPRILFQFGVAYVPVVWDILDIEIEETHFFDDVVRGMIGIPKRAVIDITLSLVEDHILNKANQIAEKAGYAAGSIESVAREGLQYAGNHRKESWTLPKIRR
jgi:hypothetical protein